MISVLPESYLNTSASTRLWISSNFRTFSRESSPAFIFPTFNSASFCESLKREWARWALFQNSVPHLHCYWFYFFSPLPLGKRFIHYLRILAQPASSNGLGETYVGLLKVLQKLLHRNRHYNLQVVQIPWLYLWPVGTQGYRPYAHISDKTSASPYRNFLPWFCTSCSRDWKKWK